VWWGGVVGAGVRKLLAWYFRWRSYWLCGGSEERPILAEQNPYALSRRPMMVSVPLLPEPGALGTASRRQTTPEQVAIYTDAQAAIRRMAPEEPGPGQLYALQARKHIAALRRARPNIATGIRWYPARKGVTGNEKAGEWTKFTAEEPDACRVEARALPLPRSLEHLKREISKKWAEGRQRAGGRTSKIKYRMPKSRRPDSTVAGSAKRLASRFYQMKTGHCLIGQYLQ